jgi:hypothetical protein
MLNRTGCDCMLAKRKHGTQAQRQNARFGLVFVPNAKRNCPAVFRGRRADRSKGLTSKVA